MRRRSKRRWESLVDRLQGFLVFGSLVFCPWAFGTVEPWSIWSAVVVGFLVGSLEFCRLILRVNRGERTRLSLREFTLLGLSIVAVLYCFVSAINARATLDPSSLAFSYEESYISWLPHSYDSRQSWFLAWQYLSLFCFFWGVRGWVLGDRDRHSRQAQPSALGMDASTKRRNLLILIVGLNAALLAAVGIAQRLDGTRLLLWLVETRHGTRADSTFGPFAYRGNAVVYINLVWPLLVGLFFSMRNQYRHLGREGRFGSEPYIGLLPLVAVIFSAGIFVGSRAGLVALIFGAFVLLLFKAQQFGRLRDRVKAVVLIVVFVVGLVTVVGDKVIGRWRETVVESVEFKREGRQDIYQHFGPMVKDFQPFGSGPGTFSSVYQLYRMNRISGNRTNKLVLWSAWAHCDPVEILITLGWVATMILIASLGLILSAPWGRMGPIGRDGVLGIYAALGTMSVHSLVDFPFQIYSLLHLFVVLCALLLTVGPDELNSDTLGEKVFG